MLLGASRSIWDRTVSFLSRQSTEKQWDRLPKGRNLLKNRNQEVYYCRSICYYITNKASDVWQVGLIYILKILKKRITAATKDTDKIYC